jgi:hypothetical protein
MRPTLKSRLAIPARPTPTRAPPVPILALWHWGLTLVVGFLPAAGSTHEWQIEEVDCPRWFEQMTHRSLQLDSEGNPHMACGGDHLYHVWHDGSIWHCDTVDGSWNAGSGASLGLDPAGRPHISYCGGKDGGVKYASKDAAGWRTETLCSGGGYGSCRASLALDESGNPHVAWTEWTELLDSKLKYARKLGLGWQIETVDLLGSFLTYPSLVIDEAGMPHISYSDGDLRYAQKDDAGWHLEVADGSTFRANYTSIALDSHGDVHISYYDDGRRCLKYARRHGAQWLVETVDTRHGEWTSLALDADDLPHISYHSVWQLRYAYRDTSGWQIETADYGCSINSGICTSVALGPGNAPHISYYTEGDLRYASKDPSGWHVLTAQVGGRVGMYTSLALGGDGVAHVSYYDNAAEDLKYAWRSPSGWSTETVDAESDVGQATSLDLDAQGHPHISYYDDGNGELRYARHDGSRWHTQVVDPSWGVGEDSSLKLDVDGFAHISYHGCGDLKYAYQDGSGWHIDTVDTWGAAGRHTSLALDPAGAPHISYSRSQDGWAVRYARWDGSEWCTESVDSSGFGGPAGTSLELGADGSPHITYDMSYCLMYAHKRGAGWSIERVEWYVGGHQFPLVLDGEDRPHVCYNDWWGKLKYAYRDSLGWHVQTVDSGGVSVSYPSLALDPGGFPHISYHDWWLGDLKYAYVPGWLAGEGFSGSAASRLRLIDVTPNPVTGSCVTIGWALAGTDETVGGGVSVRVYNLLGRLVAVPVRCRAAQGDYRIRWDLRSQTGRPLGAGVYYLRLEAGNPAVAVSRRLVVVR